MELSSRPYTFDRVVRIVIGVVIVVGLLWLLNRLSDVLLPFCVACLVAYMLEPLVQLNRRVMRLNGRGLAITVTLLEVVCALGAIGYFVVPMIFDEFSQVSAIFSQYASSENVTMLSAGLHDFIRDHIDFKQISTILSRQDWSAIIDAMLSFLSSGFDVVMGVVGWFFALLYLVFIMSDYDRVMRGFGKLVPPKYRDVVFKVGNDIKVSMNQYFRGQAFVALCVGIMFCIGFLIIGMPMAIALGLFIGVLNLVPYLQFISIVPTTLLCVVYAANSGGSFWGMFLACMVVYAVVQIIQDGFIVPKVMGKTMGLNPVIILLSLSVWGSLLGFMGLIIALPLTTLVLAYYNEYIINPKPRKAVADDNVVEQEEPSEVNPQ